MALTIEYTKNLTTDTAHNPPPNLVQTPYIACEPSGDTGLYYIDAELTADKAAPHNMANYNTLTFGQPRKSLTSAKVDTIGVKHFPRIGAMGWYKDKYTPSSTILCPIHSKRNRLAAPDFTPTITGNTLHIVIEENKDFNAYKIIARQGYFAKEVATYELEVDVSLEVKGDYNVSIIGYNEAEGIASVRSTDKIVTVATGKEGWKAKSLADLLNELNYNNGVWS